MKKERDPVVGHIGPTRYDRLDPAGDPERWERTVQRIVQAAAPELARRQSASAWSLGGALERWRRRGMAAAGLVAAAASLTLFALGVPGGEAEAAVAHPADALMPDMADWLVTGEAPTMVALIGEFGEPR
ncbi:MAG: hypothetical protein R3E98_08295 [Gemmatimonadota bacterium]